MDNVRPFPIFIDITKKKILIVGGGNIAARRVRGLVSFGATFTVISEDCSAELMAIIDGYDKASVIQRAFQSGDTAGFDMVISNIDNSEVDRLIYEECKASQIPVNIASDKSLSDFYFPALIEYENIVMGVSSDGSDHNKVREFSSKIREFLKK